MCLLNFREIVGRFTKYFDYLLPWFGSRNVSGGNHFFFRTDTLEFVDHWALMVIIITCVFNILFTFLLLYLSSKNRESCLDHCKKRFPNFHISSFQKKICESLYQHSRPFKNEYSEPSIMNWMEKLSSMQWYPKINIDSIHSNNRKEL